MKVVFYFLLYYTVQLDITTIVHVRGQLELDFIGHIVGESNVLCAKQCKLNEECAMAKYYRQFLLCKLYRSSDGNVPSVPESSKTVYQKGTEVNETNACTSECSESVTKGFCPAPEDLHYALLFGNMRSVGARLKYVCLDQSDDAVITCLENETWSNNALNCTCQIDVRNANVTMTRVDSITMKAEITCLPGYYVYGSKFESFCNTATGVWSTRDFLCQREFDGSWQYVFSFSSSSVNDILGYYLGTAVLPKAFADFRNSSVLNTWPLQGIKRVKLELVLNEVVVGHVLFNGANTGLTTWFSIDKVLSSSWVDLGTGSEGNMKYSYLQPGSQFFAYKLYPLDGGCYDDRVWLVVGQDACIYPCDNEPKPSTPSHIMYSLWDNATQLVVNKTGFADRLTIWLDRNG